LARLLLDEAGMMRPPVEVVPAWQQESYIDMRHQDFSAGGFGTDMLLF
jgi:hypothetical protein